MANIFKKILGIDKIEEEMRETNEALKSEREVLKSFEAELTQKEESIAKEKEKVNAERLKLLEKSDPKAAATEKGEAYVAVIDTHINEDNIRNGFFELDWNNEFVEQLIDAGYKGESQEEIVEAWFTTIVRGMLAEEGQDTNRNMGNVQHTLRDDGKGEVS